MQRQTLQQQTSGSAPESISPLDVESGGATDGNSKNHPSVWMATLTSVFTRLESLPTPKWLQSSATTTSSTGSQPPPLVTGLNRVLLGTQPACEVVTIGGIHPPRYLCYMISGSLCDIIQFFIDVALHFCFGIDDPSLCWALGFGGSIVFRHSSHRYLVFGDYVGGYWNSLKRMYAGYSIIIVLSTIFNIVMTRMAMLPHYVAWLITLLWTGIVNYFILKKLWSFGGTNSTNTNNAAS
ncbi:expressed unknown protein [Seminavis robusta]|uniref:GtrA-like protein domain-containing protein n=1 Tax=Seminavis robusta TaxID=568900 RepID=A0A9N8DHM7_9STRA|nr:expressed unknown protein [Seminavis robusta]|eukprot:Sro148_g068080.1 n/a (238) ;mRNA; r:23557-24270